MNKNITASKLYSYIQCPHRVWRDIYGPQEEKIQETNPFVELLWNKGVLHEENVIKSIGEFVSLKDISDLDMRCYKTIELMKQGTNLIYQGCIKQDSLLGIPDLLQKNSDGTYIPIDIKSGAGLEGVDEELDDDGKYKKHYAVQLCLYVDVLKKLGFAKNNKAIILDINGEKIEYNLDLEQGPRNKETFWQLYERIKNNVSLLIENKAQNKPAYAGICKLCPWYNSCKKWVKESGDLTSIFYLGRTKRDTINEDLGIDKIEDFINLDVKDILSQKEKDKTFLKGLAKKTLTKAILRADILKNKKEPVVYEKIEFPNKSLELFFDIEDDPTQDFVYLHGVYERNNNTKKERYLDFTAKEKDIDAEKQAWKEFWDYIKSLPKDSFVVYYYSPHEKTTYKRLQKKYPEVITENELGYYFEKENDIFIDLYQIVLSKTDWPTMSYSIKELAVYLGFKWRDETPSGALSIQWFNDYLYKKDISILERILIYNEDDCKATMVVRDGIEKYNIK